MSTARQLQRLSVPYSLLHCRASLRYFLRLTFSAMGQQRITLTHACWRLFMQSLMLSRPLLTRCASKQRLTFPRCDILNCHSPRDAPHSRRTFICQRYLFTSPIEQTLIFLHASLCSGRTTCCRVALLSPRLPSNPCLPNSLYILKMPGRCSTQQHARRSNRSNHYVQSC